MSRVPASTTADRSCIRTFPISGTNAVTTETLPGRGSILSICPRRRLRSPLTEPIYSSGVTTSILMIGSSRTGFAFFTASWNAKAPAMWNERSSESTS